MDKRNYIGKVVISAKTKNRFVVTEINAAYICLGDEKLNQYGTRSGYMFKTDNRDPFKEGDLYFEDAVLNVLFQKEYSDYCRSEEGRTEAFLYWMRTCD